MLKIPAFQPRLRVYVIDDEEDFREEMILSLVALSRSAIDFVGFHDAHAFYRAQAVARCDIAVIDVRLPGESGLALAAHLRQAGDIGIVMLSALSALEDRVKGLQNGADAYFSKPTDPRELLAHIVGLGLRLRGGGGREMKREGSRWRLAEGDWLLVDPSGVQVKLTQNERTFMRVLFAAQGKAVSREDLVSALSSPSDDTDLHRINVIVSRLRHKCRDLGLKFPVHAVRGTGYLLPR